MALGRFDTDSNALQARIQAHNNFGSQDFDGWILRHLQPMSDQRCLDLGCGVGKQSLILAQRVGPGGEVISLDASEQSLAKLAEMAREQGVKARIRTIRGLLDDLADHVAKEMFDRVVGSYSLYYAKDSRNLFEVIRQHMSPGGVLFFCGPSLENNREIRRFHDQIIGRADLSVTAAARFMSETAPTIVRDLFSDVEVTTFENPLVFQMPEDLGAYWTSHNLYDEKYADAFRKAAEEHFQREETFVTVKRVIGVRAVSRR